MKRIAAVLCIALASIVLAACAASPQAPKQASVGWATFTMPDGYVRIDELHDGLVPSHIAVSTSSDTSIMKAKIKDPTIVVSLMPYTQAEMSSSDPAEAAAQSRLAEGPDEYADLGVKTIGGYDFHFVKKLKGPIDNFSRGYANLNDRVSLQFLVYYVDLDDPAVETVMSTLVIDESKTPGFEQSGGSNG